METVFYYLVIVIPIVLFSIILHEMSHGFVSYLLGDPTPKRDGRLSLNPLKHIDPFGAICLLIFHVGWAKPVMINSEYYRRPKLGIALTALAGPLCNFILALIGGLIFVICFKYVPKDGSYNMLFNAVMIFVTINCGLCLFNLIPLPPLDGSKIFGSLLRGNVYYQYMKYERYGMFIVLGLVIILNGIEMITGVDVFSNIITSFEHIIYSIWAPLFKMKFIFEDGYIYAVQ